MQDLGCCQRNCVEQLHKCNDFNINSFAGFDVDGISSIHFDVTLYAPLSVCSRGCDLMKNIFLELFGSCVHEITHLMQDDIPLVEPGTFDYFGSEAEVEAFASGLSSLASRQAISPKDAVLEYLSSQIRCNRISEPESDEILQLWLKKIEDLIPAIEEKKVLLSDLVAKDLISILLQEEGEIPSAYICDLLGDDDEYFTVTHNICNAF